MFPSTCPTILLTRCEDRNCTKLYLVKQPVQLLLRVEKRMKISYALSSSPSFVLAWGEGGGGRKKRRGGQGYFSLAKGGLHLFIKKFRGVSSLIESYILRGVHWPRWVKQLNSRAQTIFVKQ